MPKYLVQGSYTEEGLKGLMKEGGSGRRAMVERLAAQMGGKLETSSGAAAPASVRSQ